MILADKLIHLRKKAGWSQEELAERMKVTRQSVSKWEGAGSVPDLEKIIRLSELFGVTTDYLLKDEIEHTEGGIPSDDSPSFRRVSMEEANAFLSVKEKTGKTIAFATYLCILSPICLLILSAMSEDPSYGISENIATGIGMTVLVLLVSVAITLFISSGQKTAPFQFFDKEAFETEYGVSGMVKERKEKYRKAHIRSVVLGTIFCISALLPIFVGVAVNENDDVLIVIMLAVSFFIAGIGVLVLVKDGILWVSFEKLLEEGEYTREEKRRKPISEVLVTSYWLIVTAIYLGVSLPSGSWKDTWIVWVIAGVLFPIVVMITNLFRKEK